ncbi:hypothetical protein JCM6882_008180 [Rhodosporidiobolus microsporus]
MSRTIAIIGATGVQGSSIVSSLLSSSDVSVRAITRDPSSDAAKALGSSDRLSLVQADLDDVESLNKALEGVQAVYGSTTANANEVQQGKNLVDAVKATGVEHLVLSSLPSIAAASSGKFSGVFYFEGKAAIESYAKEQLSNVTVIIPGVSYSHLARPLYTQRGGDGTVRFCMSDKNTDPSVGFLDDADVGAFVSAIFSKPLSLVSGKTYPVMSSSTSASDFAATYAAKTGDKVAVEPISKDEINAMMAGVPFGEMIAAAANDMFEYLDSTPAGTTAYGTIKREDDSSFADLGVKATSFEAWLEKSGWKA